MSIIKLVLGYSREGDKIDGIRINTVNFFHLRKDKRFSSCIFRGTDRILKNHPEFVQKEFKSQKLNYRKGALIIKLDNLQKQNCYLKEGTFFFNNKYLKSEEYVGKKEKATNYLAKLQNLKFSPEKIDANQFLYDLEQIFEKLDLNLTTKFFELTRFFLPSDREEVKKIDNYNDLKAYFFRKYYHVYVSYREANQNLTIESAGGLENFLARKYEIIDKMYKKIPS